MRHCVRRLIEARVDGVAIMTSEMDPHLVQELSDRRLPIVFLDVGTVAKRISNIRVDYATGIKQAIAHLVSLGHRHIAFISGPQQLKSARIRRAAVLKYLAAERLADESLVAEGDHKAEGGQAAMTTLLAKSFALSREITAVLTSNDLTAIGALRAIRQANLRVPADISLIGFDDIELSQFTEPPLSTIRLSRETLGRSAFEALYHSSEGKSRTGSEVHITTQFVPRGSTAQARLHSSFSSRSSV